MKNKKQVPLFCFVVLVLCFVQNSCATSIATKSETGVVQNNIVNDEFVPADFVKKLSVLLENDNMEEALASFDTIPEKFAEDVELNFLHASLLLSAGKTEAAENITDKLIIKEPANTDILNLAALIAKKQGDNTKKDALLQKIIKEDPYNPEANVELANAQMLSKRYAVAKKYYLRGLQGDPDNIQALFGYGQTSYYTDDLDTAKSTFKHITEIDPDNGMAWSYFGKLYAESENYALAIPCAEKAVKLDPGYYHHWIELANYYRLVGRYDEAIEALDVAVDIDPSYFLAYIYRAGIKDQEGNVKEALSDYMKLVECKPDYYYAYEAIGILAWGEKNWDNALNGFLKAYEVDSDNESYPLLIAAIYLKKDNPAAAKNFLGDVLKKYDRSSIEYAVTRLYWDGLGDQSVLLKVTKLDNATKRGKYLFYMALWYDLQGYHDLAQKYYITITEMEAPMFFEYRLCEWALDEAAN